MARPVRRVGFDALSPAAKRLVRRALAVAEEAGARIAEAAAKRDEARREAIRALDAAGVVRREAADLLGISVERVGQLMRGEAKP